MSKEAEVAIAARIRYYSERYIRINFTIPGIAEAPDKIESALRRNSTLSLQRLLSFWYPRALLGAYITS